jgi:3,2-trans-enoyl-CoA isomerase
MTDFGSIGLNEVALGIPVPHYWAKLMVRTIGQRPAERLLQFGLMPSASEALKLGLVDELTSVASLSAKAEEMMSSMLQSLDPGRQATKQHLRESFAKEWEAYCGPEAEGGWQVLSHPKTVKALEGVLQRLSKKKEG